MSYRRLEVSPYYHTNKSGREVVAGYGIWDGNDWVIDHGYGTRRDAAMGIARINRSGVSKEWRRVMADFKGKPHGPCSCGSPRPSLRSKSKGGPRVSSRAVRDGDRVWSAYIAHLNRSRRSNPVRSSRLRHVDAHGYGGLTNWRIRTSGGVGWISVERDRDGATYTAVWSRVSSRGTKIAAFRPSEEQRDFSSFAKAKAWLLSKAGRS